MRVDLIPYDDDLEVETIQTELTKEQFKAFNEEMTLFKDIGVNLTPKEIRNAIRFWRKDKQDQKRSGRPSKVDQYYEEIKRLIKKDELDFLNNHKLEEIRQDLSRTSNWRLNRKLEED